MISVRPKPGPWHRTFGRHLRFFVAVQSVAKVRWLFQAYHVDCGHEAGAVTFFRAVKPTAIHSMNSTIEGISIPDSKLAREITELVRETASPLLYHHSSRVYYFGALAGKRRGLQYDPELLYAGAMFHDMGLTVKHSSAHDRFEVDGANAARAFLQQHGISPEEVDLVWTAIALHTTPGIPQYMHPVIALVTAGVEMDVLGLTYDQYSDAEREAVVQAHPRPERFKEEIIQAFYDGIKHKPETTFGNVKADVLQDKDPNFIRGNFCSVIRNSPWRG